ncbi:TPA: hypothetical protein N0F65_004368 [Lagenidium giganteum]|uniref:Elicitin n=1 Tax=Lagenidium giganteum TaxID=4803 RepID=A0AAV2ZEV9_9STRA|nr:TPA: hypothetical protein N0F65_004368 [Lagenidium giganteum]
MAKISLFATVAAVAIATAQADDPITIFNTTVPLNSTAEMCNETVSATATDMYTNKTLFNSCMGKDIGATTLLDTSKLNDTDFFTYCNTTACIDSYHHILHAVPYTCLVKIGDKNHNVSGEAKVMHDRCHVLKAAAANNSNATGGNGGKGAGSNGTSGGTTPAPTPKTTSGTFSLFDMSSKAIAATVLAGATAVAFLL